MILRLNCSASSRARINSTLGAPHLLGMGDYDDDFEEGFYFEDDYFYVEDSYAIAVSTESHHP